MRDKVPSFGEGLLRRLQEIPGKTEWESAERHAMRDLLTEKLLLRVDYPEGYVVPAEGPIFARPRSSLMPVILANPFFMTPDDVRLEEYIPIWKGAETIQEALASVAKKGVTNGWKGPVNRAVSFQTLNRAVFHDLLRDPHSFNPLLVTGSVLFHAGTEWYPVIDRTHEEDTRIGDRVDECEESGRFLRFQSAEKLSIMAQRLSKGIGLLFGSIRTT